MMATSQSYAESHRAKFRELIRRHNELDQHRIKSETILLSILFMAQIMELKMLLDVGEQGHSFYYFVLALLATAIAMLVLVGILLLYVGNMRSATRSGHKVTWRQRLRHFLLCRCAFRCPTCCRRNRRRKRESSYICVPLPEVPPTNATAEANNKADHVDLHHDADNQSDAEAEGTVGCCSFPGLKPKEGPTDVEQHNAEIEAAQVKVADAVLRMTRATARLDDLENSLKKRPRDAETEEELRTVRAQLAEAKRDQEDGESTQQLVEAQRQQSVLAWDQWEQQQERLVFKKIMFWQQVITFLLYFILLMNIFITAFGIHGNTFKDDMQDGD